MRFFKETASLFFPKFCTQCANVLTDKEKFLCLTCEYTLPIWNDFNKKNNELSKIFYGKITFDHAAALFIFRKNGVIKNIIHQLKYKNNESIGEWIAIKCLNSIRKYNLFQTIDAIIPVPLHPSKKKKRGYNQLDLFAKTLSLNLNIPIISNHLIRKKKLRKAQALKNRQERIEAVMECFDLKKTGIYYNLHFLLIDDIITTGTTIESCTLVLQKDHNIKVSILAMAFSR